MVDDGMHTRCSFDVFANVLDLYKMNRTPRALEPFGQPNGVKFTLERRFGQRSDAKLALEW